MEKTVYQIGEETPVLTVMIPMFRAEFIGWVAMESLIRQKRNLPPWELVIAEEQNDETMGMKEIYSYTRRGLREANCCLLKYLALDEWIPLARKFQLMVSESYQRSLAYIFQAADYYSNCQRIRETYQIFQDPRTLWLIPPKQFVFNIRVPDHILFVDKDKAPRRDDTSGKAVRGWLVREAIKHAEIKDKGMDGNFRKCCEKVLGGKIPFTVNRSDSWKGNLIVNGFGTLSNRRVAKRFRRPQNWKGWRSAFEGSLGQIVPQPIANKLVASHGYVNRHNALRGSLG
jgi:hypothetical protein